MNYLKHIVALLLLWLLMLLFACTKNDTSTLILLGTESYVENILNAIPDTLRETFNLERFLKAMSLPKLKAIMWLPPSSVAIQACLIGL